MQDAIMIKGAKENNLKNISLSIPKNKLVVLTGVSGSGKSTIAFETLQTECQRQYLESLGMVTDEFVKPKVDSITGLSPAISVNQSNSNRNPRSTVGTVTEIFTYLRILYSKLGLRRCKHCGNTVMPNFLNDSIYNGAEDDSDLSDFEEGMPCPHCGKTIPVLTMSHFSFNKPQGACEECNGIGLTRVPNLKEIMSMDLSINEGAIHLWDDFLTQRNGESVANAGKHYGFQADLNKPIKEWDEVAITFLLNGALSDEIKMLFPEMKPPKTVPLGRYEGLLTNLKRRYSESSNSPKAQEQLKKFFHEDICPKCKGNRLKRESAEVTVCGINIINLSKESLINVLDFVCKIQKEFTFEELQIVAPVIEALKERLNRFLDVGVGYLSLERSAVSLSGGEAQRLRLASLLGSGLTGVLYVLDEPTTGLHSKDTSKLLKVLCHLRDIGNTVLVIEHDLDVMKNADYIIDIGPGAGEYGGQVVACGTVDEVMNTPTSLTGKYLAGSLCAYRSKGRRKNLSGFLYVHNAVENNLKNISVNFPIGKLTAVTGVSGSGKSSLVFDVIAFHAESYFNNKKAPENAKVEGFNHFARVITFDQNEIGRSSRSNVATYTDIYTEIRNLFAQLPEAKKQKLTPRHFSFNVPGGRCEKCEGMGVMTIPMHFMPDAEVICPVCRGKRFGKNVLSATYKGHSISDILDLSVERALGVFEEQKNIFEKLEFLKKVGLSYLKLGQSSATLSGGEAQRIKLAKELGCSYCGNTLYLLDEPTTGLHPDDIFKLSKVLDELVAMGNTMIIIEHNLDIIAMADHVIDFGPDGGDEGGIIIAQGTPQDIMLNDRSYTGRCLAGSL
ncbi:excinuclease ABC subunit UvrA [Pseudobacteroides cellulosolvens]|uniref:UvrABC system protein A n=1 Tax=Pseudobacteroides cellulosolvens ATCC 35603 = DSM 2933 TaxID=398512 RepID=A0A0L6JKS1_9FIRM|nr:excinuclease ABC subunit UvrA [Pseudobacteroides cellulosolvens]KNY25977.1 excinuclease ABC, A subunit [Pseudobacteroides cellulosolvens ATCC 35603 = DSM 2933]